MGGGGHVDDGEKRPVAICNRSSVRLRCRRRTTNWRYCAARVKSSVFEWRLQLQPETKPVVDLLYPVHGPDPFVVIENTQTVAGFVRKGWGSPNEDL